MLAFLLVCSPDTDKDIFRVSLLKTVLPFLTSRAVEFCLCGIADFFIFLMNFTWLYRRLICRIFLIKPWEAGGAGGGGRGAGLNIIQFRSISVSFANMHFFNFKV